LGASGHPKRHRIDKNTKNMLLENTPEKHREKVSQIIEISKE